MNNRATTQKYIWALSAAFCFTLPNGNKLRFDKSGLNCSNSPEEFAKAYSMHSVPKWPQPDDYYTYPCGIGKGEYLYFGKNMWNVTLTVYHN